jgi:hypothetical protein
MVNRTLVTTVYFSSGEATSHSTKAGKIASQVAGYVISVFSVANCFF